MPLPTGTVTFLFTDIVGSTQLLHELGPDYDAVFTAHQQLLRSAFHAHHGHEVDTQGDAFFVAFQRASDALACAVAAQQALAAYPWPDGHPIEVRMGLHIGEPRIVEGHYVGIDVHRAARVAAAGHGGQIVLSEAVHSLAAGALPAGTSLRDLGRHRLKDLPQPEHLYDVLIDGLRQDFPPLKTLEARPHNLPIPPTPLIGREKELAAIEALVRRENVRLVTLCGPGGTGKTRLSLQVAMDVLEDFHDGVYFVDLAPISDPELVPATIAQVLGVRDQGSRPLLDLLKDYLREKQLLLLLDNFEQVIPAAKAVSDLLSTARKLKVLVTSREVLHLRGEQDFPVPPLAVPNRKPLPPLERLTQYEAVRLFIERAQLVKPDFDITKENAPAVAEICYRLDGLPLAIELAAARVRLLPPEAMLKRLDSRLKLLTGGARDAHYRQQTLRGTIEWSYDLLSEAEQRLFRRLGVFVGGWTLEAAEVVARDRLHVEGWVVDEERLGRPTEEESFVVEEGGLDVLEGLGSLVDKSLVQQRESADGESRFAMLETIREYALERLEASGEAEAVRREHARYFLTLSLEAEPQLKGASQAEWVDRLLAEHDNTRAALAWGLKADVEVALRVAASQWRFWQLCGGPREGLRWLMAALERGDNAPARARAQALNAAGILTRIQGEPDRALTLHEQALEVFQALGDTPNIALALLAIGVHASWAGELPKAASFLQDALTLYRQAGDAWGEGQALVSLGVLSLFQGAMAKGASYFERNLAIQRTLGDEYAIAATLHNLGEIARFQGDYDGAAKRYRESLVIARHIGDDEDAIVNLNWLSRIAQERGQYHDARQCLLESLPLALRRGDPRLILEGLERCAELLAAQQRREEAVRVLSAAAALRISTGIPVIPNDEPDLDRTRAALREQLGEAEFTAAWERGETMTLAEAVAYALEESADEAAA